MKKLRRVAASYSAAPNRDRLYSLAVDDGVFAKAVLEELIARISDDEAKDVLDALGVPSDNEVTSSCNGRRKRAIKSSSDLEGLTYDKCVEMFKDADSIRKFIESHDADEDGIDLADDDMEAILYIRKDEADPDDPYYNYVEICIYDEDSVDHRIWRIDGTYDQEMHY